MTGQKSVRQWGDIYIELMEQILRQIETENPQAHPMAFSNFTTSVRPGIRRIVSAFESAGLDLSEDIEVEGPVPTQSAMAGFPPDISWPNPAKPKATYFWPDGSRLSFEGEDAIRSVAFFMFWQNHQDVHQAQAKNAGQRRLILPGDRDYTNYITAKKADQDAGKEPI